VTVLVTFTVRVMRVVAAAGPSGTNKKATRSAGFNLMSRSAFALRLTAVRRLGSNVTPGSAYPANCAPP
jgi:hypothetical protein